jgi:hypothetical protein
MQTGHPRQPRMPREYGLWSRAWLFGLCDEGAPRASGHGQVAALAILGVAHHDRVGGTGNLYALATVRT